MFKRILSGLLILMIFLQLVGCGGKTEPKTESQATGTTETAESNDPVRIAYISGVTTSPQPLININNNFIGNELQKLGRKVEFTPTRSLDNIWPMMDKEKGSPDFVYIPIANFATYVTSKSRFGGSNKYTIIAGSMNINGSVLIARPEIKTVKDLAGKKVGIANLRYVDEFHLEKVLATVGLSTSENGGNVKVIWDDIVPKLNENFGKGQYDAVCMYSAENYPVTMSKVPGSKILTSLNPNGLFGKQAPRYWLVAKRDLVQSNPEFVKAVLRGHILSTEKAKADADKLPVLARKMYLKYFEERNAKMDEILKTNTPEAAQKRWKDVEATYDPNVKYTTDIFNYLDKKGLVPGKTINDFMQIDLLKEMLKELHKPALAN